MVAYDKRRQLLSTRAATREGSAMFSPIGFSCRLIPRFNQISAELHQSCDYISFLMPLANKLRPHRAASFALQFEHGDWISDGRHYSANGIAFRFNSVALRVFQRTLVADYRNMPQLLYSSAPLGPLEPAQLLGRRIHWDP